MPALLKDTFVHLLLLPQLVVHHFVRIFSDLLQLKPHIIMNCASPSLSTPLGPIVSSSLCLLAQTYLQAQMATVTDEIY
jgi:hypothetical protein